jgi:hypothetical protein
MYRYIVSPASAKLVASELRHADERPRQTEVAALPLAAAQAVPATATVRRRLLARLLPHPLSAPAPAQTATPDA